MKKQPFTLIEVLIAMSVFVMGVAPVLGLMAANSRQFQEDQKLFQENDVLYERAAVIRDNCKIPYPNFVPGDELWDAEESTRYSGVYSVAEYEEVGEYGYMITIGVGSTVEARDALLEANGDPKATADAKDDVLQQYTMFLVKKGDF